MYKKILAFLDEHAITYRTLHHEVTPTSEDSARVRGEDISIGGKALLLKYDKSFGLFVMSAACKLDSSALKKSLGAKKLRFATREELLEKTGLVPGAVPPFGRPLLDFPLFVDQTIVANERIAFNAGSLTDSVIMHVEDYLKIAPHNILEFSKK